MKESTKAFWNSRSKNLMPFLVTLHEALTTRNLTLLDKLDYSGLNKWDFKFLENVMGGILDAKEKLLEVMEGRPWELEANVSKKPSESHRIDLAGSAEFVGTQEQTTLTSSPEMSHSGKPTIQKESSCSAGNITSNTTPRIRSWQNGSGLGQGG